MSGTDYNIPAKSGVKPSIFEVFAVESLSVGLRSAFEYLLKVLSENHPDRYGLAYRYCNEFYTIFDLAVQHHCLKSYNSSFSENFYGLKRVPSGRAAKLQKSDVYRSLLLIVGVPYLKKLLLQQYKKHKDLQDSGAFQNDQTSWTKVRLLFIRLYPFLHLIGQITKTSYQVMYSVGKWRYHSPILHVSLTELYAMTREDLVDSQDTKEMNKLRWYQKIYNLPETILLLFASGLSTGISLGAFFLQFLDWWYSREGVTYSFAPLPIPPPPAKYPTELGSGVCPLCFQKINCETLLTTSGFVFCFGCIYRFLENSKMCPVTRYPSSPNHLVRLYIPAE